MRRGESGLGIDVSERNVILRVLPHSLAATDGVLREGDIIVGVDGEDLGKRWLAEVRTPTTMHTPCTRHAHAMHMPSRTCQVLKPGLPCYSFTLLREKWHGGGEGAAASGDIYSLKSWAIADLKEDLVTAGAPAAPPSRGEEGEAVHVVPLTKARLKEHTAAHGGGGRASRVTPPAGEGAAAGGEAAAAGEAVAAGDESPSAVARGTVPAWVFNQYSELASRAAPSPNWAPPSAHLECAQLDRPKPGKSARPKTSARGSRASASVPTAPAAPRSPARGASSPGSPGRLGSREAPLLHREAPQPWRSMVKVASPVAAHAATHRPRSPPARRPPACSGLPPRPERRALAAWMPRRGCRRRPGARPKSSIPTAVEPAGRAT